MNTDVNYASLPAANTAPSPWATMRLAAFIALALLLIIGPIDVVANYHPNNPVVMVFSFVAAAAIPALLILMFIRLRNTLRKQRVVMNRFARQNGWQFEGAARVDTSTLLPTEWNFLGNAAEQLYHIQGSIGGTIFDMYALQGMDRSIRTQYGNTTPGYRTMLRTSAPLSSVNLPETIYVASYGNANYVLMNGNAMTAAEVENLFRPLTAMNGA